MFGSSRIPRGNPVERLHDPNFLVTGDSSRTPLDIHVPQAHHEIAVKVFQMPRTVL